MVGFSFDTRSLDEWRDCLRDINFWRNGYLNSRAYSKLEQKLNWYTHVLCNVGVGPTACFTRALSSIAREVRIRAFGPFDTVIEVDMKQAAAVLGISLNIYEKLAIKVAEELGLLDQEEYIRLKVQGDELRYYAYGLDTGSLSSLSRSAIPKIIQELSTKRYLLVVDNLYEPIELDDFTQEVWLPPPVWNNSVWLVSFTSQDVYNRSKPDYDCVIESFSGDDILMLILHSLHQTAKYILGRIGHKDVKYWHLVALRCFHYAVMLLALHCSSPHIDGDEQNSDAPADITSDELIRQWAAQGILLPVIKPSVKERAGEVTDGYHGRYNGNNIYQVGNVILEAFREYSLLQLPFLPATKADEPTDTAAHFLVYHGLVAEQLTTDLLCDDSHPGLESMQWITHVGDRRQGWHVGREWLSQGGNGPTALIIRHCSHQSSLFAKLDNILAKLPWLRVLDLSCTPLESLPPSICCLQELRLLSLRGCHNLTSPFDFPDTETTPYEKTIKKKISLLYLDLSHSNIKTFHRDFFHNMPNLQELMLVKCSNLVELPPSIAALSSLTTLELTGTQIKSFHGDIFEKMKKLRSHKLIDNKELSLFPGSISKVHGLIDLHIEGCELSTVQEVILEGHPTLRSFSLIDAAHIRRLSLRGCRKLESVDIKKVGALEELDLSATAIKELPANIPNLPQLRRLLLMGVPFLRRFPWHQLQRLPYEFCLDQCSDRNGNNYSPQVAQVCVSESRMFYSFNDATMNLVKGGQLLKSFHLRVTSSKERTRKVQDEEDMVTNYMLQVSVSAYADVNCHYLAEGVSMVSMDVVPPFRETHRHVEISAVDRYPTGLNYLLRVTKSISMMYDTHVYCLDNLTGYFDELEECKLLRCHRMVHVFQGGCAGGAGSLKNACVSHLKSLTHFYRPSAWAYDFGALKHLRLEHCPRLEGVMPRETTLPSLVTLDILFCYNLKEIFYDNGEHSPYQLPCLRSVRLQELPLLEHLRVGDDILIAPAWEELYVRGCWSLRHLPRLRQRPGKVKVSGERAWWAKLHWDDDEAPPRRDSYEPRFPPAFASLRERVVIKTYLR
ncbi:uncharacterized protein LOC133925449 [Phragmites australis]|uniref:uncharacterized protein LOC133925449 n=1 Tax=Phragmites australis TaxID=29695 RepID=UPI002D7940FF|nr:uncharacterized protein LOC133925449 [Phragmites australis]